MSLSPSRVASRHLQAGDEVWLPDYLGAGAPVVELAVKFVKGNVAESKQHSPEYPNDPASVAGGVFYLTLTAAGLEEDARRMWPILDSNAGLHVGSDMGFVGDKVWDHLSRGRGALSRNEKALLIGAFGVELLQRTRQISKAKAVNRIFVEKHGDALASMTPGRDKAKPPILLLEEWMTPEIVAKANQVAKKLGNDPAKALFALDWLATDINFSELGRAALGAGPSKDLTDEEMKTVRPLSPFLDWGAEPLIAFGVALLKGMGATQQLTSFTRGALAIAKQEGILTNRLAGDAYTGNPDGQGIYPNEIDHGYTEPLAGGTDVMRRLQNQFRHEQGREQRPESPKVAGVSGTLLTYRFANDTVFFNAVWISPVGLQFVYLEDKVGQIHGLLSHDFDALIQRVKAEGGTVSGVYHGDATSIFVEGSGGANGGLKFTDSMQFRFTHPRGDDAMREYIRQTFHRYVLRENK